MLRWPLLLCMMHPQKLYYEQLNLTALSPLLLVLLLLLLLLMLLLPPPSILLPRQPPLVGVTLHQLWQKLKLLLDRW